ncbi:uncharacterized protein [Eurosta solidaginis]|uniref:uncharacterized protein isoform X2 n=1 Tax=Eurosta solidaginis TaxID=178769 RepID=UPI0035309356
MEEIDISMMLDDVLGDASLEDVIEANLSDLDNRYTRTQGSINTKESIMRTLNDPELNASLEDNELETNVASCSSFEAQLQQTVPIAESTENENSPIWNLTETSLTENEGDNSFPIELPVVAGNAERKKIIETLRLRGNYLYNTNSIYNKTGELIVSRRPKEHRSAAMYKTCHNCKGVFSFKSIRRHRQSCLGASAKGTRSNVVLSRRIEGRLHQDANPRLIKIMAVLREDDIVRLVRYDELLIKFGNCLCEKYYKLQQEEMIRNRLRTLGRLLATMKDIDPDITDFKSIYNPPYYKTMVKAVRVISGFDPMTGVHMTPSLATSIGTYIRAVGELLKLHWVENNADEKEKVVDKYLFLHSMQYSQVINRIAREDQCEKQRQQIKPLPTTSDIKKLASYLNGKMISSYENLQRQYHYQTWISLLEYTLISIQTFNRRRAGEIERALILDLKAIEKISEAENPEIYEKLSATEKNLAEKYSRFMITGKLGRVVPVLLNSQMETSINLILSHRISAKVPANNPYIFGIPGFTDGRFKYLRACQLMRKFSEECGAEYPERLRGTYLRKHIATTCAGDNMDENKITDIANFMGHAEAIHRSHYRRSVVSRDVLGVANVLQKAQGDEENVADQSASGSIFQACQFTDENDKSDLNPTPSYSEITIDKPRFNADDNIRKIIHSSSEEDSSEESNSDKSYSIEKNVKKSKIKNVVEMRKIRWSKEEKAAATAAFGAMIRSMRLPNNKELRKFKSDNPWCTRTINQLRTWASNEKKKYNLDLVN